MILGLDVSSTATGWAAVDDGDVIASGVIALSPKIPHQDRMYDLYCAVQSIVDKYSITKVNIEAVYAGRNVKTVILLAKYHGAVIVALHGIPVQYVTPSEWRKEYGIVGKREEVKKQAVQIVADRYGMSVCDDEADAILISFFCAAP
jgi:Holliday junction resolvasome RuvABC endonuclease subunit